MTGTSRGKLPVDTGWAWVILVACTITYTLVSGVFKSFGILFVAFLDKYDETVAVTSLIASMESVIRGISSVFTMTVGLRYCTPRFLVITGGVFVSAGFILSTFAKGIYVLLITYSLIFGVGHGLILGPLMYLIGVYFEQKRGLATGVSVSGCCIGGLAFAPLCHYLIKEYFLSGAMLLLGGILLNVFVTGALMRPEKFYTKPRQKRKIKKRQAPHKPQSAEEKHSTKPLMEMNENVEGFRPRSATTDSTFSPLARRAMLTRMRSRTESEPPDMGMPMIPPDVVPNVHPAKEEIHKSSLIESSKYFSNENILSMSLMDIRNNQKQNTSKRPETCESCFQDFFNFDILKNPQYVLFIIAYSLSAVGGSLPASYIPAFAKDQGISGSNAALLVSIALTCDTFGRALIGTVCDLLKLDHRYLLIVGLIVNTIAQNMTALLGQFWTFVVFSVFYGFFGGFMYALYAVILIDIVHLDNFKSALTLLPLLEGVSFAVSGPVIGSLRDNTGTYVASFHYIGVCVCVACILLVIEAFFLRKRNATCTEETTKSNQNISSSENVSVIDEEV